MTQYLSQGSLALLLWRAFWLGVGIGAVYSVFGIRRAAFAKWKLPSILSALLLHLEDFLLCVSAGALLSVLYFATVSGVVRLMAIPALGVGIGVWRCTAGRLIAFCTDRILHFLAVVYRWILRRLLTPVGHLIARLLLGICRRYANRREQRFLRRLAKQSEKITRRYTEALTVAAGQGRLPPRNLRGAPPSRNRIKRNNQHPKTKE